MENNAIRRKRTQNGYIFEEMVDIEQIYKVDRWAFVKH